MMAKPVPVISPPSAGTTIAANKPKDGGSNNQNPVS
jgi:hypothetical protein